MRVMAAPRAAYEVRSPSQATYWGFLRNALLFRVLALFTAGVLALALWMALFYAPRETMMGDAQRIFYFGVLLMYVGFLQATSTAPRVSSCAAPSVEPSDAR